MQEVGLHFWSSDSILEFPKIKESLPGKRNAYPTMRILLEIRQSLNGQIIVTVISYKHTID